MLRAQADHKSVVSVLTLDLIQISGQNDLAVIDEHDILAEFFHVTHLMAGEDHQFSGFDLLPDHIL